MDAGQEVNHKIEAWGIISILTGCRQLAQLIELVAAAYQLASANTAKLDCFTDVGRVPQSSLALYCSVH